MTNHCSSGHANVSVSRIVRPELTGRAEAEANLGSLSGVPCAPAGQRERARVHVSAAVESSVEIAAEDPAEVYASLEIFSHQYSASLVLRAQVVYFPQKESL